MQARETSVQYWDQKMAARLQDPLDHGELVLIYNKRLEDQWGKRFANRWNRPFQVKEQLQNGSYLLEELDSTELKQTYSASHIKRFFPQGQNLADIQQEELGPEEEEQSEQSDQQEDDEEDIMDQSE
jgi:hypothetical protein